MKAIPRQLLLAPEAVRLDASAEDPPTAEALEFAEQAFTNAKDLIRFMDQKASYALGATGALVAALALSVNAISVPNAPVALFLYYCGSAATAVFAIFVCKALLAAMEIYRPRAKGHVIRPPGLLFPLDIAKRVGSDAAAYGELVARLDAKGRLAEYSGQVVALAAIYDQKHDGVKTLVSSFVYLVTAWLAAQLFFAAAAAF